MKRILPTLLFTLACLAGLTACEETEVSDPEYANWPARNSAYFADRMAEARAAIAEARRTYGEQWEDHCDWRLYRNYSLSPDADVPAAMTDSVCVEIVERGAGTVSPIATDSVRVCYTGRLIPTDAHTDGKMFDHSGLSDKPADVFDSSLGTPAKLSVEGNVAGFATVLQHMHTGDRWRMYIPQELGYAGAVSDVIPAYSTLIFEVQLKAIYPAGTIVGPWK